MPSRKMLLQIMLWCLGLGAAAGVLAVLIAASDVVYRVMWTAFLAALAAALLMPIGILVDRRQSRAAGLLGMGATVVSFVLGIGLIWEVGDVLPGGWDEDEMAVSIVFIWLACLPAMGLLALREVPRYLWAGTAGLFFAAGFFVAAMAAIWIDGLWKSDDWWGTSWTLGGWGLATVACLAGADSLRERPWRWAGVAAASVSALMLLTHIWAPTQPQVKLFAVVTTLACVVAHANLMCMVSVASGQHWLRLATIAAGVTTGVLLDLIIIFEIDLDGVESIPGRLTAASAILATCGSLALLILARFHRRIDLEGPGAAALQMTIVCPRCRKRQRVAVGSSTCCRCDLRLHIRVEEPRCPKCEYLLYGIESDRCPECGQELARAGGDE